MRANLRQVRASVDEVKIWTSDAFEIGLDSVAPDWGGARDLDGVLDGLLDGLRGMPVRFLRVIPERPRTRPRCAPVTVRSSVFCTVLCWRAVSRRFADVTGCCTICATIWVAIYRGGMTSLSLSDSLQKGWERGGDR